MLSRVYTATCIGIDAFLIEIEVDAANGMPKCAIVGLPDQAVRESRERVRSAMSNSGFSVPLKKTTVSLAPADLKKEGPVFDLAIALGILAASGLVKRDRLNDFLFAGELALDGSLRKVRGALPIAELARRKKLTLILPHTNEREILLLDEDTILLARNLNAVVQCVNGEGVLEKPRKNKPRSAHSAEKTDEGDFSDVKGQWHAKRACEIAASGFHNILLIGPPGSGKTMLARRLPSILPNLNKSEVLEIAKITSAAGGFLNPYDSDIKRPFRAPHHTTSQMGLVGGGSFPKPGEITLAHRGILFLDEFPEFRRDALEGLRAPMEDGFVLIARARMNLTFPSQFLTVCAMNPCPCGYLTSKKRPCRCTAAQIQKYHQKISGPILDRLDLHVEIPAIEFHDLAGGADTEPSAAIRERVIRAREIQANRFQNCRGKSNALMTVPDLKRFCAPTEAAGKLLEKAMNNLELSARGYHKILKISRTIADLAQADQIEETHVAEAIQYRTLDRNWFG